MAELVVAPRSCIGRVIFSKAHEKAQQIDVKMIVQQIIKHSENIKVTNSDLQSHLQLQLCRRTCPQSGETWSCWRRLTSRFSSKLIAFKRTESVWET